MKTIKNLLMPLIIIPILIISFNVSFADVPHVINYQGRLTDSDDIPLDTTVDLTIVIFGEETGTTILWGETHLNVIVSDGLFSVLLGSTIPIPDSVFNGQIRWLGVQIESGPVLEPLTPIVSTAYAYRSVHADTSAYAISTPTGPASGWIDEGSIVRLSSANDSVGVGVGSPSTKLDVGGDIKVRGKIIAGSNTTATGENANAIGYFCFAPGEYSTVGGGNNCAARGDHSVVAGGMFNYSDSNWSAICGGHSNKVENHHAFIGGGKWNNVSGEYSSICGGHADTVYGDYSVVGGGRGNVVNGTLGGIAAGYSNIAGGYDFDTASFVGGGFNNHAYADYSTIAGGLENSATAGGYQFIGGGFSNVSNGTYAVLGGGYDNASSGIASVVPGGSSNHAIGNYSFAAGVKARANHSYTFVWSDDIIDLFESTNQHQFLISAENGVGINGNNPMGSLDISQNSNEVCLHFSDGTRDITWMPAHHLQIGQWDATDSTWIERMRISKDGDVGIGKTNPSYQLDCSDTIRCVNLIETSDVRLKKDIRTIDSALNKIESIRGVSFKWYDETGDAPDLHLGVIAQEIENILPELVSTDKEGMKSVEYTKLTAVLIEAVKELSAETRELKVQNEMLIKRLEKFENRN